MSDWDKTRAWAKALSDEQLTAAIYELRERGFAVIAHDANSISESVDVDFGALESWMSDNLQEIEDAMHERVVELVQSEVE